MAGLNLVIGLGGTGKGVLNWLKRALIDEYGSVERVRTVILNIDTAVEDQYRLDDGFMINTATNEFLQLEDSPREAFRKIREGEKFPFIDEWLTKEDAENTPDNTLDPIQGIGYNRVSARAILFLEATRINDRLNRCISTLRGFESAGEQSDFNVFIVGSQAGGTGSGTFIDIAQMVINIFNTSQLRDRTNLIGLIALPNSFADVFTDNNEIIFRDARSFAFSRELLRAMYGNYMPIHIKYTGTVEIKNTTLFDFCFLIDGAGRNINLGSSPPVYGVCPLIADLILLFIKDQGELWANLRGDKTDVSRNEAESKFSSFGLGSFIYPYKDIARSFALKFTYDLLKQLVTLPPGRRGGETEAEDFLKNFNFTSLFLDLKNKQPLRIEPPTKEYAHFIAMKNSFLIEKGSDPIFPSNSSEPVWWLEKSVKRTTSFLRKVTNQSVIDQCKRDINSYLGDNSSHNPNTVWGWVNNQIGECQKKYLELLAKRIYDLFFDGTKGDFKTLDTEPYLLMIGYEFLKSIKDWGEAFNKAIKDALDHYNDPKNNPVTQQEDVVRKKEEEMLKNPTGTDRYAQEDYINESQKLLNLYVWKILLQGFDILSERILNITNKFWKLFGDPMEGWKGYLDGIIKQLGDQYQNFLDARRTFSEEIPTREYFPKPNSIAELQLYKDYVTGKDLFNSFLTKMSWEFFIPVDMSDLDSYQLYLRIPSLSQDALMQQNVINPFTGQPKRIMVGNFSYEDIEKFGENVLGGWLKELDIWDLMVYEYQYEWKPERDAQGKSSDISDYIRDKVDRLMNKSENTLSTTPRVTADQSIKRSYAFSNFLEIPNPQNLKGRISTTFSQELERRGNIDSISSELFNKYIFSLNLTHIIPFKNWAYHDTALKNYITYMGNSRFPIHLFKETKNAYHIEESIRKDLRSNIDYLDSKVVCLLKDLDVLRTFTFVYLLNLLPRKPEDNANPASPMHFYLSMKNLGITREIDLGRVDDIYEVIKNVIQNDDAQEEIKNIYKDYVSKKNPRDLFDEWQKLYQKIDALNISNDLKLVFKVFVYETLDSLSKVLNP
jgi:hypothetical protein